MSVAFPHPSRHLLAGGAPLRWFTVGLKHDEIHVSEPVLAIKKEITLGVTRKTRISSGLAIVVGQFAASDRTIISAVVPSCL